MSYAKAKQCFSENKGMSSTKTQPKEYNINLGLLSLTEAIESDMSQIRALLVRIAKAIEAQGKR
jgi:hypothetical protein